MEFLSDIELYYSLPENISGKDVLIKGEEVKHITRVMRHTPGDIMYVTNGEGKIFKSVIKELQKDTVHLNTIEEYNFENKFNNVNFCIPKLKSNERFEFALEKCVELGITNFIIYESSRSITKGEKADRWNKILVSAMKQSLHSYLPVIKGITTLRKLLSFSGEKIIFEQHSDKSFKEFEFLKSEEYYFIFGPEGGLSPEEINLFDTSNIYNLASNRLRSETAIIKAASLL